MKLKSQIIFLLFFFFSVQLFSQQLRTEYLTFDAAIAYAVHHAPDLIVKRLLTQQQQEQLLETRLDALPDIYATSDLRRNLIIPTTPIPAHMIDPSAPGDEMMYMRFNTPWSSATGLNLSYDLFNPQQYGKTSEQKKELNISKIEAEIAENDIRAAVAQAYIDCVISGAQLQNIVVDTLYYAQLMVETEKQFQLGKISQAEKNQIEINYNTVQTRFLDAKSIYNDSKINLLLLIGVQIDNNVLSRLSLSEDIETLYRKLIENHVFEEIPSLTYSKLTEQLSLSQLKTRNTKLQYLPSFTLSGFYGANYFGQKLHLTQTNRWFGNSFLALSLHIPIVQSLSTSKVVSQLRIQEMIDQENIRAFQNEQSSKISGELARFDHLIQNYKIKQKTNKLWNENLMARSAEKDKGYILESDFWNEKLQAQNAFQEYLQAAYELLSAYIRIEKLMKE